MDQDKKINTDLTTKSTEAVSFFEKDSGFVFVYKKTEKLTSAVYMVTNLLSDNEPIKWSLRKKVSDLLSFTVSYKDITESEQSSCIYNVKTRVLDIVSLLDVSRRSGLVSEMNCSILKQEFLNLVNAFVTTNPFSKETDHSALPGGFFDVATSLINAKNTQNQEPNKMSFKEIKDRNVLINKGEVRKSNRQNIIINLLRKKKELTIKDIALVIKDCSEKTIQRELIALISEGVVKRAGERRWSKYSLNG